MRKKFCLILVSFFLLWSLSAEPIAFSTYDFVVDLPEGFKLVDSNENDRFLFSNEIIPCSLQVLCDSSKRFSNLQDASENIFKQLNATHKDMTFFWCEKNAQLSTFNFNANGQFCGWLLVLELQNGWLTMVAYSSVNYAKICENMIISAFDSVYTSQNSFYVPGPVTSCLYARKKMYKRAIDFAGKTLSFYVDEIDMEAAKSVVDREFSLLTLYLSSPHIIRAWQRYYRNIYRDSWQRLQSFAFEIKNILNAKGILSDKYKVAMEFLQHVQNFAYIRNHHGSDFTDLVTAAVYNKGDCDSRSLLMALVLQQLGIRTTIFISPELSHAIAGVAVLGSGAKMQVSGVNYLVAETTAKVQLGKISIDMADPKKWFGVELYSLPESINAF